MTQTSPKDRDPVRVAKCQGCYRDRDCFHVNGGISEFAACFKYARARSAALSFPWSISSTGSEGASQLFVVTLYTEACTPWALCSEKSRRCSLPTLISAHTPSVNMVETRTWRLFYTKPLSTLARRCKVGICVPTCHCESVCVSPGVEGGALTLK